MKCPCCEKELTAKAADHMRAAVARLEADPPAAGTLERSNLALMQRILKEYDEELAALPAPGE